MSSEENNLGQLRASRGYVKASITRIVNSIQDENFKNNSIQFLKLKLDKLSSLFSEYESYNKKIIFFDDTDAEDVSIMDDKYYITIAFLQELIDSKCSKGGITPVSSSGAAMTMRTKLPRIELTIFSGLYSEYVPFRALFDSLIHNDKHLDTLQKMYYLRSHLKDEPFDIIKDLPLISESYEKARKLLDDRYNNTYKIVNEHICKLLDLSPLVRSTSVNIRSFVSSIKQILAALENLNVKVDDWNLIVLCIITRKLDVYTARAYQLDRVAKEPTVPEIIEYLEKRALALENAEPSSYTQNSSKGQKLAVNMAAADISLTCYYCKSNDHKIFNCKSFKLLSTLDRYNFSVYQGLCKICLNKHTRKCKFYFKCDQCKASHNSLIHHDEAPPVTLLSGDNFNNNILLPTAQVRLLTRDKKPIIAKAILDSGSQASLVTSALISKLGLTPTPKFTSISGIGNSQNNAKYCIPLQIQSLTSPFQTSINCHVVDKITCRLPQDEIDISTIKLPEHIVLADRNFNIPSNIEILMGADVFFQILLPTLRRSDQDQLGLINTQLGYVIGGSFPQRVLEPVEKVTLFCSSCESEASNNIKLFWEAEKVPQVFNERCDEQVFVENIFKETVVFKENKNQSFKLQVDLPLKVPLKEVNKHLGNSFELALHRFLSLEKKLAKNPNLLVAYQNFIDEYVELGHGQYIDFETYDLDHDAVYFLPHHAVFNENSKTTPVRVVFDASMKTNKRVSLNDLILNGPVVQRELFDILLLYRIGDFNFSTDIKKMFRNILINPEHRSLQIILWRDNPNKAIQFIRLNTVTYGMKCSSYLATRCLIEIANRYEHDYPLAAFILKNCTYVDDVLYSCSSLEQIKEAKRQLQTLLMLCGFLTHKWASNNAEILADIPIDKQHFDELDLQKDSYCLKVLGMYVDVKKDCFIMSCPESIDSKIVTKRSILSYIAKLYDPMGFVSPIIIRAKFIMQKVWLENIDWDASPSEQLQDEWLQFARNLAAMEPIQFSRNISVPQSTTAVQLIGFADASSSTGYGCCVYLRVISSTGKATLSLICSKSRVNSLKRPVTIPRGELNAALLLSQLMQKVQSTLMIKIAIDQVFLFTDSMVVLGWLNIEVIQLQAYVANRIKIIKQNTSNYHWLYVNTKDNPADLISRGVDPRELAKCSMWWHGPLFLQDGEYQFQNSSKSLLPANLPEQKMKGLALPSDEVVALKIHVIDNIFKYFDKYSDIHKMTRVMAYLLRFCNNVKNKEKVKTNYLTTKELQGALNEIIKYQQSEYFVQEIRALRLGNNVEGMLKALHPFLDNKGLLRVGGRLKNFQIPYSQRHQIILHKESKVTELIIRSEHIRLLHAGPKLLLSSLNQKYWLVNGIRQVKKITHKCIVCFRLKAQAAKQLMGSLPQQRVTACKPFNKVGVDFAGPLPIKNSRVRRSIVSKGYICVFVCFVTKAVHLELASDLSTDTFLACLKRFISRRGLPSEIFADNGSNFKGAANQLIDLYKLHNSTVCQNQVQSFSSQLGITFKFMPSYSPVFAGLAEAAVKSTKFHLKRVLQNLVLTYEQLNTILVQIEGVLNSRPLVPITSDINDFSYLTPGHFLTGNAIMSYPERDVSEVSVNRLTFWKICQNITQRFWKIWHKYYLNTLQCRPKWQSDLPNIKVGALVILRDSNCSPLQWPMARISKVFPGSDGKVRALEVTTSSGKAYTRSLSGICVLPIE